MGGRESERETRAPPPKFFPSSIDPLTTYARDEKDPSLKIFRPRESNCATYLLSVKPRREETPATGTRDLHYYCCEFADGKKIADAIGQRPLKRLSDSLRAILRTDRRPHDQFTALSTTASKPQPPRGPPPHRGIPSVAAGASERARRRGPTRGSAAGRTRRSPCARRGGAGLKPRRRPGAASR